MIFDIVHDNESYPGDALVLENHGIQRGNVQNREDSNESSQDSEE